MTTDAPLAAPALPWWRVERVLFDESGWLVVDKPAGIPVHGGDEELSDDCVGRLHNWLGGQGRVEKLAVHQRLDLETTGCLFFVTDPSHNAEVARAMEAHQVERRYVAVVQESGGAKWAEGRPARVKRGQRVGGSPPARRRRGGESRGESHSARPLPESGTLECWLSHDRGQSRVSDQPHPGAKHAITHFQVLWRDGQRTALELRLETGRPHQIRASLAHLGHPVVGDRLYGGAPAARLMLHARALSGGPLPRSFESPLPKAFESPSAHRPTGAPAARRGPAGTEPDARPWRELLEDAVVRRAGLSRKSAAYRLVNGEGDGLAGLTVDAYGPFLTFNVYDSAWMPELDAMAEQLMHLGFGGAYLKQRVRSDLRKEDARRLAPERPFAGEAAPSRYLVDEHGMKVGIELGEGLSTGLFVDMRHNRRRMRTWIQEARSRRGEEAPRMLNLFSYTCSFSLAAALEGAHTTSIDLAGRALSRGRDNFRDNELEPAEHRFFKEDAMKYLSKAVRRGERYDAIVLDPPSFATVGKSTFNVSGHYVEAAEKCFRLLQPGGRLLCVTNHLKTSEAAFCRMVRQAAAQADCEVDGIRTLPPALDCPPAASGPFPSRAVVATASLESS